MPDYSVVNYPYFDRHPSLIKFQILQFGSNEDVSLIERMPVLSTKKKREKAYKGTYILAQRKSLWQYIQKEKGIWHLRVKTTKKKSHQ